MDLDKRDLLDQLEQILRIGKDYRKEGEGIKASVTLGVYAASFETIPQTVIAGGYSRQRRDVKGAPEKAKTVVQEYADLLNFEDTPDYYFVGTKVRLDDKFDAINQKLKDAGFRYVRWDKEEKHTGGWRGKK